MYIITYTFVQLLPSVILASSRMYMGKIQAHPLIVSCSEAGLMQVPLGGSAGALVAAGLRGKFGRGGS